MGTPIPADNDIQEAPRIIIDASITAPDGSVWAYNGAGYSQIVPPWAVEDHIPPIKAAERFGDIESWVAYVARFGQDSQILLTWSRERLRATLDYHGPNGEPGRGAWTAEHPFETTREWREWAKLTTNQPISQKALIEALEARRPEITKPDASSLLGVLAKLRGTVNESAEMTLDGNGNTSMSYGRVTTTSLSLPPSITITIPILKGHVAADADGKLGPVSYTIEVLIRVDVVSGGQPQFRLSWPNAEASLEHAVDNRVAAARELLGAGHTLLRAAS